ncbi:hypothetical protein [Saccharothrix texasensis]|nr:hypothetical protein [Saccharothrix texasensis]
MNFVWLLAWGMSYALLLAVTVALLDLPNGFLTPSFALRAFVL